MNASKVANMLIETSKIIANQKAHDIENGNFDENCVAVEYAGDINADDEKICDSPVASIVGVGIHALELYDSWKAGELTDSQYLQEVIEAKDDVDLTAAGANLLIPIQKIVKIAGKTRNIPLQVAIVAAPVVAQSVQKAVKESNDSILKRAKCYKETQGMYQDLIESIERSENALEAFIKESKEQDARYNHLQKVDKRINKSLKDLYDSI